MKNKYLIVYIVLIIILFVFINRYQTSYIRDSYNKKINSIINSVVLEYPNISEEEIIDILYSDNNDKSFSNKLGLNSYNYLIEMEKKEKYFFYLDVLLVLCSISGLLIIFYNYDKKKDKRIEEIINLLERINRREYDLKIKEMDEDNLSILKNELYKTTIMLNEVALNEIKDKENLKNSLADISHQLKTPLTSISLMLDNLIDDPEMDEKVRMVFISKIKKEIINITFLIQSILKLSTLETNTIEFKKDSIKIKDLINKVVDKVSILSELKNIDINIVYKNDFNIVGDMVWQIEALSNVLKNSLEHTKDKIDITISCNNVYGKIEVRDYGNGISKKDLSHIFERFYKGENSLEDSNGIGLSLAKAILNNSNGDIIVESSDKGSTFIIKYYF